MPDRYYLWGAGSVGKRALEYLQPLGILDGIIDNDSAKHGQMIRGLKVSGYDSLMPRLKESGIIIAHFEPKETEDILNRDTISYWRLSEFVTMFYCKQWHQHAVGFLDFTITTRCTLNCRDCMQFIPYRPRQDTPLEMLKRDIDALFRRISFVGEISIIGGEPFLHGQLPEFLEYIIVNYRGQIGSLVITTNGTIAPDSRVLELCRKANVFISVSDYGETLPYIKEKISKLEAAAQEAGVSIERKRWSWTSTGRFDCDVDVKKDCTQTHMQLSDGKLWHCTLMAAGCLTGFCDADRGYDYYNLLSENNDAVQDFLIGNGLPKRTSQCGKCLYPKGVVIPSAVQT